METLKAVVKVQVWKGEGGGQQVIVAAAALA